MRWLPMGLVVLLLGGSGCDAALDDALLGKTKLTFRDAQGTIELEPEGCFKCKARQFAIVKAEQLPLVRKASSLTYLGTQGGFHFFMTWNKVVKRGEVADVAVHVDECDVTEPHSVVGEPARGRRAHLSTGRCFVR